jgi:hypothetical protein
VIRELGLDRGGREVSYRVIDFSVVSVSSRVLPCGKPHKDGIEKRLLINKIRTEEE